MKIKSLSEDYPWNFDPVAFDSVSFIYSTIDLLNIHCITLNSLLYMKRSVRQSRSTKKINKKKLSQILLIYSVFKARLRKQPPNDMDQTKKPHTMGWNESWRSISTFFLTKNYFFKQNPTALAFSRDISSFYYFFIHNLVKTRLCEKQECSKRNNSNPFCCKRERSSLRQQLWRQEGNT